MREFYPADYRDPGDFAARAASRAYPAAQRHRVAAILERQAERLGLREGSRDALERFRRPDALVVVAGQQPGLFGGPLYTLYKALTAVSLAREAEDAALRPVVPIFWVASDDHDFEEVRRADLGGDAEGGAGVVEYPSRAVAPGISISRVVLGREIEELLAKVEAALPPSEFRVDLLARLHAAYRPGATWADAFGRFMGEVVVPLGALVFDPSDRGAKEAALPVFEREVELGGKSTAAARAAGDALVARGYHAQISREGSELNLFWHGETREAVRVGDDGALRLAASGKTVEPAELIARMREHPEDVSPGVLLRPLMQDHLFPTAAYVGGPSEIAYWAQVNAVYPLFDAAPPAVAPRAGATLLEPKVAKVLDRFGIAWPALAGDVEKVVGESLRALLPDDFPALFEHEREVRKKSFERLEERVTAFDPSLKAAVSTAVGKVEHEAASLEKKLMQVWKRRQDESVQKIRRAASLLFPGGKLQERVHSPLGYAARYGPGLAEQLTRTLGKPGSHVLVPLGGKDS